MSDRVSGRDEAKRPVLVAIEEGGLVPLISSTNADHLVRAAEAIVDAGLTVMEVTLRAPNSLEAFDRLITRADQLDLPLTIGVGTVLDVETADAAIGLGAGFIFSPVVGVEVGERCLEREVAWFPGCATPTEVHAAMELGCDAVKLFPAHALGGPAFLRSIRSVFSGLAAIPSGGVALSPDEFAAWYRAGAIAVGMGSTLFPIDRMAANDWGHIERRVHAAVSAVQSAREEQIE